MAAVALVIAPQAWAASRGPSPAPEPPAESGHFGDVLARHGLWLDAAGHRRAWRPSGLEEGWRPYLHGWWTFTKDGWFWVTDEPWGAATYHYGRWGFDGAYGWVWFPGRTWAPAWVAWRWDAEVVGWAPLPPEGKPAWAFWTFVPASRFVGERADAVALPAARVPALLVRTRPAGGASTRPVPPCFPRWAPASETPSCPNPPVLRRVRSAGSSPRTAAR